MPNLEPRKRNKRKRLDSDSPPPLRLGWVPITPSPEPDHQDSLTPAPALPCSEALQTTDVIRNVLRFVDRPTLQSALTVSTPFYMAAGPLYFRHVKLTDTDTILKILNQGEPVRATRRHTKKTMTPLLFLKQTAEVTLGFHSNPCFPDDWMSRLGDIMPNVVRVEILHLENCRACGWNEKCKKAMWALAGRLGASHAFLRLNVWEGEYSYESTRISHRFSLPMEMPKCIETLTITLIQLDHGWRNLKRIVQQIGDGNGRRLGQFRRIRVMIPMSHRVYVHNTHPSPTVNDIAMHSYQSSSWRERIPTMQKIANDIVELVAGSNGLWEFYMLLDIFPQDASFWPESLRPPIADRAKHIPDMVHTSLKQIVCGNRQISDKPVKDDPQVIFKTRDDYLQEPHRFGIPDSIHEEILRCHTYTANDYGEVTGLFGTWEL